jgi:predicted dinucleotide-binding enzyme
MRIGILGSGLMGGTLGTLFARAGHEVVFSYSRSEQKLKRLAREAQGNARAGRPAEAPRATQMRCCWPCTGPAWTTCCGDDSSAKEVAATLIRDIGFDPLDAGPLRSARYTEPFSLLIGQLAYEGDAGPELAYRFERFGK